MGEERYFIERYSSISNKWEITTFHNQADRDDGFLSIKELLIAVNRGKFQVGLHASGVEYRIVKRVQVSRFEDLAVIE